MTSRKPPSPELIGRFAAIVGDRYALTDPDTQAPFLTEWRRLYHGRTPIVLRPGSVAEVAEILKLASESGTSVVPQSGNTGLVGAQVPDESGSEIVVSVSRLDAIRAVDPQGFTMTVEAGVILERVQQAADEVDRLFPLSLAAEGSCEIGGNISTNAGGTGVLAYGNTRDLVLGLEVVLPTGEIWNGLRRLRKDNTGYDLKHLFIGAEGTLGIVTAAVLKLFPKPAAREVAIVGLARPEDAVALFDRVKKAAGNSVVAFELMARRGLEFVLTHVDGARDPMAEPHPWYVLVEIASGHGRDEARGLIEETLGEAFEAGLISDAAVAESLDQAADFWHLRHMLSEVQLHEGGSIKHDIAVPIAAIPAFLDEANAAVEKLIPGCRPVPFGHLGDGNLHYNISQPEGADKEEYLARWDDMSAVVHEIVRAHDGSISAEHGIGRLKRHLMDTVRDPLELDLMRRVKRSFDPNGIMNPGRVL
ncbi:FAD-binding oxidoreductase [Amorphus orientalis]|uniref:FAD/FMN-containing dehydrogenase n=1 Tax=Amorphus orientalis TaxID=649198 RepID=A0AAE4AQQ5_9HYPH|nr:FAD-binding oxidoreductase [Amorphus orientalis]MDQ0314351.1 FAD/FMN-containing dehydrogenase [Amorphus orientalis]